ncbi:hypothetical protein YSY43_29190 [Paenibacillus sp. YSY-4.3]
MRWVSWLVKLSITVVIVSMLTVATTGYVVNWYIQSLLGSYNIPLDVQSPNLGSMMKGMLGFGGKGTSGESLESRNANSNGMDHKNMNASANTGTGGNSNRDSNRNSAENGSENSRGGTGNSNELEQPAEDGVNAEEGIPEDALPVMGGVASGQSQQSQQSQQDSLGSQDQVVIISPDDLLAKKDELPDQQKEEIFNILMSKLPEEEMRKMTEAMEGGLTESEMIEIQQILSKHLDKEQYAKVMDMLKK